MKTYIPVAWNFEDLEDKILDLLDSEEKRKEIASNGQDFYRSAISNYGMEKFCKWFINRSIYKISQYKSSISFGVLRVMKFF